MAALPSEDNLDGDAPGFNQGIFKQALRDVRGFLAGLLGTTGVADAALAALKMLDPESVLNLKPTFAVGSGALTATVKDKDGNDLSATNLGFVSQRSATLGDGGFNLRKIAANVALTVPSGATLGHADGIAAPLFWYLVDKDAATQLLAVCGQYMGRSARLSTTAIDTGADSASVLYAAEAVADKPARLAFVSGDAQTTAGTWAALPSAVQPAPFIPHFDRASAAAPIVNGKIVLTHNSPASNKLTIALKTEAGNDPSLHDPVVIAFRSGTATDSRWVFRAVIAALSLVISNGSTLGHASAINQHLFVYAIDTAAGVELAASNLPPDYPGVFGPARLVSTTAEGGAGAADSATGIYSTTARSNVPWTAIAKAVVNNSTAGNWASAPVSVDMAPFRIPSNVGMMRVNNNQTINHATFTKVQTNVADFDPDGICDTTNYRIRPNVAGPFRFDAAWYLQNGGSNGPVVITIDKNNSEITRTMWTNSHPSGAHDTQPVSLIYTANGTTDYFDVWVYQGTGASQTLAASTNSYFTCHRLTGGQ